jgi:hypothetical protein
MKWDLFNPYPTYNYSNMPTNLDVSTLENPYIQVIWEDTPENFTQERIKSVKQYFMKKYSSSNINVITKVKTSDEDSMQTIDVSVNIMDKNYQTELVKTYLESKGQEQYFDQLMNIDLAVENRMLANEVEVTPFKRWYIKKIEFDNFLSYGQNQVIDFDKCNGITVVESDPPNSNENLEMVGEFFSKMKNYFEKIFVITHNPLVNNWANNTVRITKTDNISKVSQ